MQKSLSLSPMLGYGSKKLVMAHFLEDFDRFDDKGHWLLRLKAFNRCIKIKKMEGDPSSELGWLGTQNEGSSERSIS